MERQIIESEILSKHWRGLHEDHGLATLRTRVAAASGISKSVGEAYLKELEEKQGDDKHEDAVAAVMDANKILARANKISFWAIIVSLGGAAVSLIAAGVSIWVAFFKD